MADVLSRRELFALLGAAIAGAGLATAADAGDDVAGSSLPRLEVSDPAAMTLGYVPDAAQIDAHKYRSFRPGQNCASCLQLQGKAGETWRPCVLFPKKLVSAAGWCSGFTEMM